MMEKIKKILLLLLVSSLVACSYAIDIVVTNLSTGVPSFALDERSYHLIACRPIVREVYVFQKVNNSYSYQNIMWHIKSDKGSKCIQKISYGEIPEGFNEVVQAKALQQGEAYVIVATAWGSSGEKEFVVP